MAFDFLHGDGRDDRPGHLRASGLDKRVDRRLRQAIEDLFLPESARLDERRRAAIHHGLAGIVAMIEAELRRHAARTLVARGATGAAESLLDGPPVLSRLSEVGLLRDADLLEELIARVELDLLFDGLAATAVEPDRPRLLVRCVDSADGVVAGAALALLAADGRRSAANEGTGPVRSELPAELHQRMLWWVAAAVREQVAEPDGAADRDQALADATLRNLAAYDEGDRPEAAAVRLASAIDARPDELGPLLIEAMADRRATLFVAMIARAARVDYEQVRHVVIDPWDDLLAVLLHAIGVDRPLIARIGIALAEADPRRDLERLADAVDRAVSQEPAAARAALAPLALDRDFRAAVRLLARGR